VSPLPPLVAAAPLESLLPQAASMEAAITTAKLPARIFFNCAIINFLLKSCILFLFRGLSALLNA
jgi:hypothetical protein